MGKERLPIGDVSKRTGIPVKTLRFYSDEGLVPPSGRSRSGYRLYSEDDIVQLGLVRSLREAGVGLGAIRAVLRRDMTLTEALQLRLAAVEAHITSLRHVAAALRAALRSEPTEQDIRRLCAVTRLSNEERKAVIERFYEKVAEGIPIDKEWMRSMIEASAPKLPDDPTPAQLDAWIELAEIVSDPKFVESLRANAKEVWKPGFDMNALRRLNAEIIEAAKAARERGVMPESQEARAVLEPYLAGMAKAAGRRPDEASFRTGFRERFARQDPRASRYWELVALLNGKHEMAGHVDEWKWVLAAVLHHVAPAGAAD
jgi:DNA-binding transcriptional MerR regulator